MALPLLSTVSALVRFAFAFVRQGVARGLSANSIIGALRVTGKAGRRTDLLKTIRYARELKNYGETVRGMPQDRLPDPRDIPLAPHKIRRQFSYQVELSGVDADTRKPVSRYVTVTSDTLIAPKVAAQWAAENADSELDRYAMEEITASVSNIMQRGPSGLF